MSVLTRDFVPAVAPSGSDLIAPDCRGLNFWAIDRAIRDLLTLYLDEAALRHFTPHFERLGELAGGRLDELARRPTSTRRCCTRATASAATRTGSSTTPPTARWRASPSATSTSTP